MSLALIVGVLSVVAGVALVLLGSRSERALSPVRTFALVASVVVVLTQLLPGAVSALGLRALLVFGFFLVLPSAFERVVSILTGTAHVHDHGHHHHHGGGAPHAPGEDPSWIAVELGFVGLLAHKIADGMALAVYAGDGHEGHAHTDILLAIAAHTVPVTAVFVLAFAERYGRAAALRRAAALAVASTLGVMVVGATPMREIALWEPWIAASASGLLLHVIGHDWHGEPPGGRPHRLADLLAIVAGFGLVALGGSAGHPDHGGAYTDLRPEILHSFLTLSLETAPVLLAGLVLGALVQTFGGGVPVQWRPDVSAAGYAVRGALAGTRLPNAACRVLPVTRALQEQAAPVPFVVALLLAAPQLGIESLALTARFLGWPFAIVRVAAAVAIAVAVALVVARWTRPGEPKGARGGAGPMVMAAEEPRGSMVARILASLDGLLWHIGPFLLVGLVSAAYLQAGLAPGALVGLSQNNLDLLVIAIVALPGYVCAASAVPLAAVLLLEGFSPGAVLVGLLLGPTTHVAMMSFLYSAYGRRAAAAGLVAIVVLVGAAALGIEAAGIDGRDAAMASAAGRHAHGPVAKIAAVLLAVLVLRIVLRSGLRPWLATLGDAFGRQSDDAQPTPVRSGSERSR